MTLLGASALLLVLGGLCALALARQPRLADAAFGSLVVSGCALAALVALRALSVSPPVPWTLAMTLPGGPWNFGLDGLSAWFMLLLTVAGGITTVYGVRYMEDERAHRSVAGAHATWAILLAAMIGVLVARSAVLFLVTWEVMALSAYFLILFDHEHEEVRRAGLVYLVLTHLGTLGLLLMFISWAHAAPDFSFTSLALARGSLPWGGAAVLLLALFGFGIKAGVFPFHFWLPGAHAAAPSHVSALLSGVMLKMGIYGLLRVLSLLGPPPAWWGWMVLLLGLVSAILGVLWTLAQQDLKRALAYSSVENIGIILLGMGLGALGTTYHQPAVAFIGYTGALLHALNHALFKSLLFLGAGAVARATGTRAIDLLGGLARAMPRTALAFLIGCVAIVGLPPLNGFVSEWILVRGFLNAGMAAGPLRFASLGVVGLGLVSALALACFARLSGTVFLGVPREPRIQGAREAGFAMLLPMMLLGTLCAFIGLMPAPALRFATPVAGGIAGALWSTRGATHLEGDGAALRLFEAAIFALGLGVWAARAFAHRRAAPRGAATWGCAFPAPTPRMQYTASSFSAPALQSFLRSAGAGRGPASLAAVADSHDRVLGSVAHPLWNRIKTLALSVRPLHQGRMTSYLQNMIWTVLLLLGYVLFAATGGRS